MKYIKNHSNNPHYNLAFEEYCFKYLDRDEDYVILWINSPAIIVGKNQNTSEEINADYIKENDIKVVRRITGGGAVYHDLGNLNFSIIKNTEGKDVIDFKKYNIPILKSLKKLGVNCELSGRNDLTVDQKKFSGIAQSVWKKRVLNHGTILFDTKLDTLGKALNVKPDKLKSKGVKSVKSRVTNIKPFIEEDIDIERLRELLLEYVFEFEGEDYKEYQLNKEEIKGIDKLFKEKYNTWDWNYGRSPEFNYTNKKRFPFGIIEVGLGIKDKTIEKIKIYGDFFGTKDVKDIEDRLTGLKYEKEEIKDNLGDLDLKDYF
jgi:lipoate---protein ligase